MSTEEYNVVFYGEISDGYTAEEVTQNLITMFKVPEKLLKGVSKGRPLLVKDHVDYQTAEQYKTVFERAGSVCKIEAAKPPPKQEAGVPDQSYEDEDENIVSFQDDTLEILTPDGWAVESVGAGADIVIKDSQSISYFVVFSKPKSDFRGDITYKQYSQLSRDHIKKHNSDYQEVSGPRDVNIHGMMGVQYEMSASKEGIELHYFHTMIDGGEAFYQLIGVSPAASYQSHKTIFENTLSSFCVKELFDKDQEFFDAVKSGNLNMVQRLIERECDVNAKGENDMTPLHYAAHQGHSDVVRILIERGADVNAREQDNGTPLHYAAMEGFLEIVRLLIEQGADIHAVTREDITALHMAIMGYDVVERRNLAIGELLIEKGADVDVSDAVGLTPLELARMQGPTEFVRILREAGAIS